MKVLILVIALVFVALGATVLTRGNDAAAPSSLLSSKTLVSGTKVIDVRTQEEYDTSHVKDALLFPLQTLEAGQLPELTKDAPIAVYCRSGNRSSEANTILKNAGYTNVTDLGGINNLATYGLKVE